MEISVTNQKHKLRSAGVTLRFDCRSSCCSIQTVHLLPFTNSKTGLLPFNICRKIRRSRGFERPHTHSGYINAPPGDVGRYVTGVTDGGTALWVIGSPRVGRLNGLMF